MARRKKEDPIVHKNRISKEAGRLFTQNGINNTTMDEIAKAAGYSKATLYVYFKNKEDIVSYIALNSMEELLKVVKKVASAKKDFSASFFGMCNAIIEYADTYPQYFEMTLRKLEFEVNESDSILFEIYEVGEQINKIIFSLLRKATEKGELPHCEDNLVTVMYLWSSLAGMIKLASEKEEYIKLKTGMSKRQFLDAGIEKLYNSISS